MLVFTLPHIQGMTGFMKERELKGYFVHTAKPEFSWNSWFDRSYQDTLEKHLKDSIPLKPSFVRLRNQVDFSLFHKIHVRDAHVGKNGQFFRYTYYFTYGGNYPGDEILEENIKKLKRVQDKLKAEGKQLLFVIAADKLWYFQELVPDEAMNSKSTRFYDTYVKYMKKYGCDYIDFNEAFLNMKDTIATPLFAKGGYHWTEYSGYIAMDSIANYLRKNGLFVIDEIKKENFTVNNSASEMDLDIYNACNLQFKLKDDRLFRHPHPEYSHKKGKTKAIICGDSFCNAICWNNFFLPYFDEKSTFWYYNREIYGQQLELLGKVGDPITEKLLEKSDIYIVLFSAGNLEKFEYDFLDHFEK